MTARKEGQRGLRGQRGLLVVEKIKCGGDNLFDRDIVDEGDAVATVVVYAVEAADGACQPPGMGGAMPRARDRPGIDKVEAPVEAHSGCAHRTGEVQRARVVRDNQPTTTEQTGKATQRETVTEILRIRAHRVHYRLVNVPLTCRADNNDLRALVCQRVAHDGELRAASAAGDRPRQGGGQPAACSAPAPPRLIPANRRL